MREAWEDKSFQSTAHMWNCKQNSHVCQTLPRPVGDLITEMQGNVSMGVTG